MHNLKQLFSNRSREETVLSEDVWGHCTCMEEGGCLLKTHLPRRLWQHQLPQIVLWAELHHLSDSAARYIIQWGTLQKLWYLDSKSRGSHLPVLMGRLHMVQLKLSWGLQHAENQTRNHCLQVLRAILWCRCLICSWKLIKHTWKWLKYLLSYLHVSGLKILPDLSSESFWSLILKC